jgi:ABC-type uncharacterized transport system substrate-binding protein
MNRREFITLLGGAAVTWPFATWAQQSDQVRRIGVLMGYAESNFEVQSHIAAFRERLQKLGWTEGRHTLIDTRWAAPDQAESRRRFAKELVALQPDVILSNTTPTTTALLEQTLTIPIVFAILPTRSAAASSRASRGLVATSPVSSLRNRRWRASGWNCSRRLRRASPGSRCCSTRHRRHMPNVG